MIKKLAWNTFKNTGDINTYLELVEAENIEKQMENNLLISEGKIKNNLGDNINNN
ncbi:MAG: YqzL family protein [Clostridiaceae bacterium]|nr:YqzL family protein [Clostridiaceae bacterium]